MDNDDLKRILIDAYKENPFYFGAEALSGVISKLDISSFSKENLDTLLRFIDTPQNSGDIRKSNSVILGNKDITYMHQTKNLVQILKKLPDFFHLDPDKYHQNLKDTEILAGALKKDFKKLQKRWDEGDLHQRTAVLAQAFDLLNEKIQNAPSYEFASNPFSFQGLTAFCPKEYKIKIKQDEKMYEHYGFSGILGFFVHEIKHAKQFQSENTDPMMRLYNFYYIPPSISRSAYFKNYIEMDASDMEEKFIKTLDIWKTNER